MAFLPLSRSHRRGVGGREADRRRRRRARPALFRAFPEPLERRVMLATRVIQVQTLTDDLILTGAATSPFPITSAPYSLREAMIEAHRATEDTVVLELMPGAAYSIQRSTDQIINSSYVNTENNGLLDPFYGDFDIGRDLVINGNGAFVRAERLGRIFQIKGDVNVTINDLNILTGGGASISQGAGVHVSGGADVTFNNVRVFSNETAFGADAAGGGLYADNAGGTITIRGGEFSTNVARGSAGATARGGAIYLADGRLDVDGTSFYLNGVHGGAGGSAGQAGGSALGGALHVERGVVSLVGATFSGNQVNGGRGQGLADRGGDGGPALGGAIYVQGSSGFVVRDSQFTGNRANGGYGAAGDDHGGRGGEAGGGAIHLGLLSVDLSIRGGSFRDNVAWAGDGGRGDDSGGAGGLARGGAISGRTIGLLGARHTVSVRDGFFRDNLARGGRGGEADDGPGGLGGDALGGAIALAAGGGGPIPSTSTLDVRDTPMLSNRAMAGDGGGVRSGAAGRGGDALGGAVATNGPVTTRIEGTLGYSGSASSPTALTILGTMSGNAALAGSGGSKRFSVARPSSSSDAAGRGGDASGGAVAATGGTLTVTQLTLTDNASYGGNGGSGDPRSGEPGAVGTRGGDNGTARGGALFTTVATTLTDVAFVRNTAAGGRLDAVLGSRYGDLQGAGGAVAGAGGRDRDGRGLDGGDGGSAYGGAALVDGAGLTVVRGSFLANQAIGGLGGPGAAGADIPGRGEPPAGYVPPSRQINWTPGEPQAGGRGGTGGGALGGGLGALSSASLTVVDTVFAGNAALAGRGGSGGRAGTILFPGAGDVSDRDLEVGARGGDGGRGGAAGGGAATIDSLFFTTTVAIRRTVAGRNLVVGGDGGLGGQGGGAILEGGVGGWGGEGGNAHGGGFLLSGVDADLEEVTVERNTVAAGWGGAAGYGGVGLEYGGSGGRGGDGGDAGGGGIALMRGRLDLESSTISGNALYSGPGGNGGFGGPGVVLEGGNGGRGGDGGDARGGGVYVAAAATANTFTGTAVTVAYNALESGFAGFGGAPGDGDHTRLSPIRYEGAPNAPLVVGALGRLPESTLVALQSRSTGAAEPFALDEALTFGLDLAGGAAVGTVAAVGIGGGVAAVVGAGLVGGSISASATAVASQAVLVTTGLGLAGLAGTGLFTVGAFAAGGAVLLIGAAIITRFVVTGFVTGDWELAARTMLGTPGAIQQGQINLGVLVGAFGAGDDDDDEVPLPPPPGVYGPDGNRGVIEGTNLWGAGNLSLSRTIAAAGDAAERRQTRTQRDVVDNPGSLIVIVTERYFEVRETTSTIARSDVHGAFLSDGTNLIGAVDSGFANDLKGTTASPLDPRLDTQTRFNGGSTPTLKLLPGSPARRAVGIAGSDTSQNGFVWSGTADIGAWGGPANRAPVPVADAMTVARGGAAFRTVGQLLANDADADGDTLRIAGGFVAQHGTVSIVPFAGDPSGRSDRIVYTPDPGYVGPDTIAYSVTDGEFIVASTIDVSVLAAEFAGLSDLTIEYGTEQITLTGRVLVGGEPAQSPLDWVDISFADYSGTFEVNAVGNFVARFFPPTLSPAGSPYVVTYRYFAGSTEPAAFGTSLLTVNTAPVTIRWRTPLDITYGTPLSAEQLNALATVPIPGSTERLIEGIHEYTPGAGIVLPAGDGQLLNLVFTPDEPEYRVTTAQVAINVKKATPTLTAADLRSLFDGGPQAVAFAITGAFGEDLGRELVVTYTDSAGNVSTDPPIAVGTYLVTISFPGNANYEAIDPITRVVEILPTNLAPVATEGLATTDEDRAVEIDLWHFVADVDTPLPMLRFLVGDAENGAVELLADGHTVRFTPASDHNGPARFSYTVIDDGDGSGISHVVGPIPFVVVVFADNDPPVQTVPDSLRVDEDGVLRIVGLGVADPDADEGDGLVRVSLSVDHGTLEMGRIDGLSFLDDDGSDGTLAFTGRLDAIDAALAELSYRPFADFNGVDRFRIVTDDLGNTGAGGPRAVESVVDLFVEAINDAPTHALPGPQTAFEDVDLTLGPIVVSDVDADEGTGLLRVTLGVRNGMLSLGRTDGLTFGLGDGTLDRSMTFTGTPSAINAALLGLVYRPDPNFSGEDTLTITTDDLGNTGRGGPLATTDRVTISVRSASQQAASLDQQVSALVRAGVLNTGQGNALQAKLGLKGNNGDVGKVEAFLNQVRGFLAAGNLSQAQAAPLIEAGEILVLSLTRK